MGQCVRCWFIRWLWHKISTEGGRGKGGRGKKERGERGGEEKERERKRGKKVRGREREGEKEMRRQRGGGRGRGRGREMEPAKWSRSMHMNNHIYSTLFKIEEEREPESSSKEMSKERNH